MPEAATTGAFTLEEGQEHWSGRQVGGFAPEASDAKLFADGLAAGVAEHQAHTAVSEGAPGMSQTLAAAAGLSSNTSQHRSGQAMA